MNFDQFEKKKKSIEQKHGHSIGWTRREFMSHGLLGSAGFLMTTTLLPKFMQSELYAAPAVMGLDPFFCFDMSGGAALAGNVLVGKAGGPEDYLKSYDVLGWDPKEADSLDKRFGLPFSKKYSGLLRGILLRASAEAQKNLRMASVCHFSLLDSSSNKQNASALAAALGLRGQLASMGFGNTSSSSGGNSASAYNGTGLKANFVRSITDIIGAVRYGGKPYADISQKHLLQTARASRGLAALQAEAMAMDADGKLLKTLSSEAYEQAGALVEAAGNVDPRQDANVAAAFNINANTQVTDPTATAAGIINSTMQGMAGPGTWTLNGCDYHTGNATTGDAQDQAMGEMIGRSIELAYRLKKPFFFQLVTDGSCGASRGTRNWSSDSNEGVTIFGYYDPKGAPEYVQREGGPQVGAFTDGQGADRSTIVGADAQKAAFAVFANYCALQGKLDDFKKLLPSAFSDAELQKVLVFKQRTA